MVRNLAYPDWGVSPGESWGSSLFAGLAVKIDRLALGMELEFCALRGRVDFASVETLKCSDSGLKSWRPAHDRQQHLVKCFCK